MVIMYSTNELSSLAKEMYRLTQLGFLPRGVSHKFRRTEFDDSRKVVNSDTLLKMRKLFDGNYFSGQRQTRR